MVLSARAGLLCLFLSVVRVAAHGGEASCAVDGSCEEHNVTLLQRLVQLEPLHPPAEARASLVQGSADATHSAQLAACTKQASLSSHLAAYMTSGPVDAVGEVLECGYAASHIRRDSGEEAAGYFRAMDAAMTKALAVEPPNKYAAALCIGLVSMNVVFNRELTMVMNRTTHTMEHIVYLLKRYPDDVQLNFMMLQMIAGDASACCPELTPFVVRLGGLDLLFNALDNFEDHPNVLMSAWRGLSDHSHNAFGASLIANHGGPMKGIHFVVEQMRTHAEPYLAEDPHDHLSLKYEIMQIANGLLEHDYDNTYGAAFIREGLPEQILYSMRVEPELRGTQTVACQCMNWLLDRDPTAAKVFDEAGAVEALVAAVDRFRNKRDSTQWCGTTLGASYPVVPPCSAALVKLGQAQPATVDQMLQLGLLDSLHSVLPAMETSVVPLKELLEQSVKAG